MVLETAALLVLASLAVSVAAERLPLRPVGLRCEYLTDPLGIDVTRPRLSWALEAGDASGVRQSAYRILVASTREGLATGVGDLWDSGKVESSEQTQIEYVGAELGSRRECWWKVRVWDGAGRGGSWSRPARWEMGLPRPADWKAEWVVSPTPWHDEPGHVDPAPFFRKEFRLAGAPSRGRVYVCGLGYFELWLNGTHVGKDVLAPNQTDYDKRDLRKLGYPFSDCARHRQLYVTYDVTKLLRKGTNVVGVILGNGWYNQKAHAAEGWMWYGAPRVILRLEADRTAITTDATWKVSTGPITFDQLYTGEVYDARLEMPGWSEPGFDDAAWKPAVPVRAPDGRLCAQMSPPDRVSETLRPLTVTKRAEGDFVLDFGQNFAGWCRLRVRGSAGAKVTVTYGEELVSGLPAPCPDQQPTSEVYVLKGTGVEVFEPHFTWFAGRYVRVAGWPGEMKPDSVEARVVHSAVDTVGEFECSNELLNRIHRAFVRTQLDNMQGGRPSDCPQRERLGYTGDGHVAAEAAMSNFDLASFYTKWIADIGNAQDRENEVGYVPHTVPYEGGGGGPAWGSAIVILPWLMYIHYGDTRAMREQYEAMKLWVTYFGTWENDGIVHMKRPGAWNLGEWLPAGKLPPEELVHTFYYALCADLLSRMAGVLGKRNDQEAYAALAGRVKEAFHRKFFNPKTNSYGPGAGANVFGLALGGAPGAVADTLVRDIMTRNGGHLDTGFLATPLLFDVFSDHGRDDVAFAIMNQKTYPSYGYMLEHGATTIWESWDGKVSHNHPALGAGVTWLYKHLAGLQLDPVAPGYQHVVIKPAPVWDVTWCRYAIHTLRGRFVVEWRRSTRSLTLKVTIPPNCTATVSLADGATREVGSGEHEVVCDMQ